MEGVQILFGTKRTVTEYDNGSVIEKLESMHAGKVVGEYTHYRETLKDPTQPALSLFIDFMEFMSSDKRRINPIFEQKTDEGTGKLRLVHKQWSEKVK